MQKITLEIAREKVASRREMTHKKVLIYSAKWDNFWLRGGGYTPHINKAGVFYLSDAINRLSGKELAGDFHLCILNDFESKHWSMTKGVKQDGVA